MTRMTKRLRGRVLEESQKLGELLCEEEEDLVYFDYPDMF